MNLIEAVHYSQQQLENCSDTARLDAELLVSRCCQQTRAYLYTYRERILTRHEIQNLQHDLKRRMQGEPMAYILGHQEFWSLSFQVTPDTLIPRPETEHLIEWVLTHFSTKNFIHLADLGTGCGNIALTLAKEKPHWHISATERSPAALKVAKHNAINLQQNVSFYLGSWCQALPTQQRYDVLVSNPPYLDATDPHLIHLQYEPREALVADHYGLAAFETIAKQASYHLNQDGYLVLEHGCTQAPAVTKILKQFGLIQIETHLDLAGLPRFTTAQCKTPL